MSVIIVCPHCEYDFRPSKVYPDGYVRCGICEKTFLPTPEQAAVIAEAVRAAAPEPEGHVPVAEVVAPEPAWARLGEGRAVPARARAAAGHARSDHPWTAFARGSLLVCAGVGTELVAFTALVLIQLVFMSLAPDRQDPATKSALIGAYKVLCGLGVVAVVVGSGLVAAGRTEQVKVPEDRMSRTPPAVVAIVGWVGVVGMVLGLTTLVLGIENLQTGRGRAELVGGLAFYCLLTALACRASADVGALMNLGLVSGAMPSRALRDTAGTINVVGQVFGLCYLGLVGVTLYSKTLGPLRLGPDADLYAVVLVCAICYGLALGYGLLNLWVNNTARRAADGWEPGGDE